MDETKFVDIHAHLCDNAFEGDRDELISKLDGYLVLNAGEYPEENDRILELGRGHSNILPCIGLHPNFFTRCGNARREEGFEYLFSNASRAFAISEVGLDFNNKTEEQTALQKKMFMDILEIAEKNSKVCIVHSRKAMESMLGILPSFKVKAVMHNFEGNATQYRRAMEIGAFVSVSTGFMKYKKDGFLRKMDPERFFVETDSPVLSPDENRNTPLNIPKLLDYIAKVRRTDVESLKTQVYSNFKRVFSDSFQENR